MGGATLIVLDHCNELDGSGNDCRIEEIASGTKQVEGSC